MASAGNADHDPTPPSVFLSYASEDRSAARAIRDALTQAGLNVWYDENELGGGDEWDQKIRRQIRECDYFMPVVSARTQARHEGYFRREWRLAVDRTLDIADGHLFLIPVVIDDTDQATARVPDRFTSVQWIRAPEGKMTPAFRALCSRLVSGAPSEAAVPKKRDFRNIRMDTETVPPPLQPAAPTLPEFPVEEPGQRIKFWVHVVGWFFTTVRMLFKRLPRWARFLISFWLIATVLSRGCTRSVSTDESAKAEAAQKLKAVTEGLKAGRSKTDTSLQGVADIARAIAEATSKASGESSPLLAVPFSAPTGDTAGAKFADSTFTLLYGKLSISHPGQVGISKDPLASLDPSGAAERAREGHSAYVLCGAVAAGAAGPLLTVDIFKAKDASVSWTKDYPVKDADPAAIAADIESHVPPLDDD